MSQRLILALVVALMAAGLAARTPEQLAPVRYDGYRIVHVELDSADQLEALLTLGAVPLDCHVGVGPLDLAVPPGAMGGVAAAGIDARVLHPDAQALIDAESERVLASLQQGGIAGGDPCAADWFDDLKPIDLINQRLDELVAAWPDFAEKIDIGQTVEGRSIFALRITSPAGPDAKPGVLFNGCQHAREWIAPMVPMYIASQLLCQYDSDPEVQAALDAIEFFVVPVVNPDGYDYSWPPGDRFWRKNRRDNGDGTMGVDLNRNWDFGWGGGGSSDDPADNTYHGPAPFSEPETSAMKALFEANPHIVATIDFHSYSQLVLSPWGYVFEGPDDGGLHAALGLAMADAIGAVHGEFYEDGPASTTLYQAAGVSVDWTWGDQGIFSYTIELRDEGQSGFLLPPEEILPTAEENFAAALTMAQWVTSQGVVYSFPGGLPDELVADQPTDVSVTISPVGSGPLDPGTAEVLWRIDGEGGFQPSSLVLLEGTSYLATLPATACGSTVEFYFQIESDAGVSYASPAGAPGSTYAAGSTEVTVGFSDDFEEDLGWTVVNNPDLSDGAWEIGVPAGGGDRGDPPVDGDGSGACYLTDNEDGNSDVDDGSTTLVSPLLDASDPESYVEYLRWYSNDAGSNPFQDSMLIEISGDGGDTWALLEEVDENAGAWVSASFRVGDFVTPGDQVQVRFTASDPDPGSVVEAGVDAVQVVVRGCDDDEPPSADLNDDGVVDVEDLIIMITSWGLCEGCPADIDGNGEVEVDDLVILITNWG